MMFVHFTRKVSTCVIKFSVIHTAIVNLHSHFIVRCNSPRGHTGSEDSIEKVSEKISITLRQ